MECKLISSVFVRILLGVTGILRILNAIDLVAKTDLVTLKLRVLTRKTHFAQILIPALMMV
jgi:hypothetical protein